MFSSSVSSCSDVSAFLMYDGDFESSCFQAD